MFENDNDSTIIFPCAFVLFVISALVFGAYKLYKAPYEQTERQLEVAMHERGEPGVTTVMDGWGNPIHYDCVESPKLIIYEVVSGGPDEQMGTTDDMVLIKTDLNKSRIIGEWLGERTKQAAEGLVDGFVGERDFPEEESVGGEPVDGWLDKMKQKFK